ncbi:MAG: Bug family tripartite tricarboxylate transporter substrate binding protein [Betaproteobacteria bacterium]
MMIRVACLTAAAAAVMLAMPSAGQAQPSYPLRPILVIVPLAAASASDVAVRTLTERLSAVLKQQVLVENHPGAAGLIGTERAAKAAPDGYTLTALNSSIMTTLPHVYRKAAYDPFKSFVPITVLVTIPTALIVHPSMPVRSVKELVALAKARPGELLYSSGGVGSPQHLAMEMFRTTAKLDLVHVPYKGAVPATNDLIGGHVQLMVNGISFPLPHIRAGKLRALATTGGSRTQLLPDIPTMQEAGVSGYLYEQWLGLFAPAGTPPEIINRLNTEAVKILTSTDVRERLTKQALEAQSSTPEQLGKILRGDFPRMAKVVKQVGLKPE